MTIPNVDGAVGFIYGRVLRPLYWRPVVVLLGLATLVGSFFFARYLATGGISLLADASAGRLVLPIIVSYLLQIWCHELAHAMTCKHFRRQVHRAGVGWYFFMPVAFVDTSDIWMAGRGPRAAVAFAGPGTSFVLAGLASLFLPLAGHTNVQMALFQFAAVGFILGLANMNPLLEFDGYYVLMDLLDVPNLRTKALAFIGAALWRAGSTTRDRRLQRIFSAYGALTLFYTLFIALTVLAGYRGYVEKFVGEVLPPLAASLLGWALSGAMASLIVTRAWSDLRNGVTLARRQTVGAGVGSD